MVSALPKKGGKLAVGVAQVVKIKQWMMLPMISNYKEECIILALISGDGEKHQIR
jgi:hypothetical protein